MVIRRSDLPFRSTKQYHSSINPAFSSAQSSSSRHVINSPSSLKTLAAATNTAATDTTAPSPTQSGSAASNRSTRVAPTALLVLDKVLQRKLDKTKYLRKFVERAQRKALNEAGDKEKQVNELDVNENTNVDLHGVTVDAFGRINEKLQRLGDVDDETKLNGNVTDNAKVVGGRELSSNDELSGGKGTITRCQTIADGVVHDKAELEAAPNRRISPWSGRSLLRAAGASRKATANPSQGVLTQSHLQPSNLLASLPADLLKGDGRGESLCELLNETDEGHMRQQTPEASTRQLSGGHSPMVVISASSADRQRRPREEWTFYGTVPGEDDTAGSKRRKRGGNLRSAEGKVTPVRNRRRI
ncbi:hypothetical protein SVAN01_09374 [Stagonosporopsis vannaccii]|nr:hypothetical protein SVAN01_09374 [Stagonosporopsis vannaccii]